jgi:hypothetical protein
MSEPKDPPAWSRVDLLTVVAALQRQLTALTATTEALRAELDSLARSGKRQSAPCSMGIRVPAPKPPGRYPSSGPGR